MINVRNFLLITLISGAQLTQHTGAGAGAQVLEIQASTGVMRFRLIENQSVIVNTFIAKAGDSVQWVQSVEGYAVSLMTGAGKLPVTDSNRLQPSCPHLRGTLTAPIEIFPDGSRQVRLDRLFIVHGSSYPAAYVESGIRSFRENLRNELFLRLLDTVIKQRYTPLADTLKDRYGHPDRAKMKKNTEPLMDSLAGVFTVPDLTPEEINRYADEKGIPGWDGKFLILGTLEEGLDVLNQLAADAPATLPLRLRWRIIRP